MKKRLFSHLVYLALAAIVLALALPGTAAAQEEDDEFTADFDRSQCTFTTVSLSFWFNTVGRFVF